ncbi:hypothetical protein DPEC_G00274160 [Dallia pectoralis]|uniref:Uncharacterized protein n=1 Tax=Dallia pectoralis TaxID=75939 RepID=A0ACC2FKZ7_DALPE|nr:hypothetical protein DPEC_G00274160 [Dallia pectoralis]
MPPKKGAATKKGDDKKGGKEEKKGGKKLEEPTKGKGKDDGKKGKGKKQVSESEDEEEEVQSEEEENEQSEEEQEAPPAQKGKGKTALKGATKAVTMKAITKPSPKRGQPSPKEDVEEDVMMRKPQMKMGAVNLKTMTQGNITGTKALMGFAAEGQRKAAVAQKVQKKQDAKSHLKTLTSLTGKASPFSTSTPKKLPAPEKTKPKKNLKSTSRLFLKLSGSNKTKPPQNTKQILGTTKMFAGFGKPKSPVDKDKPVIPSISKFSMFPRKDDKPKEPSGGKKELLLSNLGGAAASEQAKGLGGKFKGMFGKNKAQDFKSGSGFKGKGWMLGKIAGIANWLTRKFISSKGKGRLGAGKSLSFARQDPHARLTGGYYNEGYEYDDDEFSYDEEEYDQRLDGCYRRPLTYASYNPYGEVTEYYDDQWEDECGYYDDEGNNYENYYDDVDNDPNSYHDNAFEYIDYSRQGLTIREYWYNGDDGLEYCYGDDGLLYPIETDFGYYGYNNGYPTDMLYGNDNQSDYYRPHHLADGISEQYGTVNEEFYQPDQADLYYREMMNYSTAPHHYDVEADLESVQLTGINPRHSFRVPRPQVRLFGTERLEVGASPNLNDLDMMSEVQYEQLPQQLPQYPRPPSPTPTAKLIQQAQGRFPRSSQQCASPNRISSSPIGVAQLLPHTSTIYQHSISEDPVLQQYTPQMGQLSGMGAYQLIAPPISSNYGPMATPISYTYSPIAPPITSPYSVMSSHMPSPHPSSYPSPHLSSYPSPYPSVMGHLPNPTPLPIEPNFSPQFSRRAFSTPHPSTSSLDQRHTSPLPSRRDPSLRATSQLSRRRLPHQTHSPLASPPTSPRGSLRKRSLPASISPKWSMRKRSLSPSHSGSSPTHSRTCLIGKNSIQPRESFPPTSPFRRSTTLGDNRPPSPTTDPHVPQFSRSSHPSSPSPSRVSNRPLPSRSSTQRRTGGRAQIPMGAVKPSPGNPYLQRSSRQAPPLTQNVTPFRSLSSTGQIQAPGPQIQAPGPHMLGYSAARPRGFRGSQQTSQGGFQRPVGRGQPLVGMPRNTPCSRQSFRGPPPGPSSMISPQPSFKQAASSEHTVRRPLCPLPPGASSHYYSSSPASFRPPGLPSVSASNYLQNTSYLSPVQRSPSFSPGSQLIISYDGQVSHMNQSSPSMPSLQQDTNTSQFVPNRLPQTYSSQPPQETNVLQQNSVLHHASQSPLQRNASLYTPVLYAGQPSSHLSGTMPSPQLPNAFYASPTSPALQKPPHLSSPTSPALQRPPHLSSSTPMTPRTLSSTHLQGTVFHLPDGSMMLSQGSGMMSQGSGMVSQGSGMMSQGSGMVSQGSGMVSHGSGMVSQGSGMVSHGSGMVSQGSGMVSHGSGMVSQSSGMVSGSSKVIQNQEDTLSSKSLMFNALNNSNMRTAIYRLPDGTLITRSEPPPQHSFSPNLSSALSHRGLHQATYRLPDGTRGTMMGHQPTYSSALLNSNLQTMTNSHPDVSLANRSLSSSPNLSGALLNADHRVTSYRLPDSSLLSRNQTPSLNLSSALLNPNIRGASYRTGAGPLAPPSPSPNLSNSLQNPKLMSATYRFPDGSLINRRGLQQPGPDLSNALQNPRLPGGAYLLPSNLEHPGGGRYAVVSPQVQGAEQHWAQEGEGIGRKGCGLGEQPDVWGAEKVLPHPTGQNLKKWSMHWDGPLDHQCPAQKIQREKEDLESNWVPNREDEPTGPWYDKMFSIRCLPSMIHQEPSDENGVEDMTQLE